MRATIICCAPPARSTITCCAPAPTTTITQHPPVAKKEVLYLTGRSASGCYGCRGEVRHVPVKKQVEVEVPYDVVEQVEIYYPVIRVEEIPVVSRLRGAMCCDVACRAWLLCIVLSRALPCSCVVCCAEFCEMPCLFVLVALRCLRCVCLFALCLFVLCGLGCCRSVRRS